VTDVQGMWERASKKLDVFGEDNPQVKAFKDSLTFEDIQLIGESNFDFTNWEEWYPKFLELKNSKNSIIVDIELA
jgi:hypothetical protein